MTYNPSVKLTRLYECTSKKGTPYLRGRLGFANVVILKSDQVSDSGQPIWNVLISEPEQRDDANTGNGRQNTRRPDPEAAASAARGFERDPNDAIPF